MFYNNALQLDPLLTNYLVVEKSPYVKQYRLRMFEKNSIWASYNRVINYVYYTMQGFPNIQCHRLDQLLAL